MQNNTCLKIRKPAPRFNATAYFKGFKKISLDSYKGQYVVLFFWPLDFTFVCPTEILEFSERSEDFKVNNCQVIGCSIDSKFAHLKYCQLPREQGGLGDMKIPLISDLSQKISKDYQVIIDDPEDAERGVALRGTFIIDDKGILRHYSINDTPVGRNVEEVLRLVQAFQYTDKNGEVCQSTWKPGQSGINTDTQQLGADQETRFFKPIKIGDLTFQNRIVMAAMTRMRCDLKTQVPNELQATYYSQRVSAAFIITEAISISQRSNAFPGQPGIFTDEQTKGWERVNRRVHQEKGFIFAQLFHSGRATHSSLQNGLQPWAPSAIKIRGLNAMVKQEHEVPHEMSLQDIEHVKREYKIAAENAKKAGFDGVQLGAHSGYLIDQFIRDGSNKRNDQYGGSIENRTRLCLETIDILIEIFGAKHVGIKITPIGRYNDMFDSQPIRTYEHLIKELNKKGIGFIEIRDDDDPENFEQYNYPSSKSQIVDVYETFKSFYNGVLIANNNFTQAQAENLINQGVVQMVSFGRLFISNPDLPIRIKNGNPINTNYDVTKFYQGGKSGYTDYPTFQQGVQSSCCILT